MEFKEMLSRYRTGIATEEEKQLVEAEIERLLLLSENLDTPRHETSDLPKATDREYQKMRKRLRKSNLGLIAASVALIVTMLTAVVAAAGPAFLSSQGEQMDEKIEENNTLRLQEEHLLDASYWSAEERNHHEYFSDLTLTIASFTELFHPEINSCYVLSSHSGIGSYDLSISLKDVQNRITHAYGTLIENDLTLPMELTAQYSLADFAEANSSPDYALSAEAQANRQSTLAFYEDRLSSLPEYISVSAQVTFPEHLTMEELLEFETYLTTLDDRPAIISWVGIYNGQGGCYCGMNPFSGSFFDVDNEDGEEKEEVKYPFLYDSTARCSAETLEQHFLSLLSYSADQQALGKGLAAPYANETFYEDTLAFVKENGANAFGAQITCSPQTLLKLMEEGVVFYVSVSEAWITP